MYYCIDIIKWDININGSYDYGKDRASSSRLDDGLYEI